VAATELPPAQRDGNSGISQQGFGNLADGPVSQGTNPSPLHKTLDDGSEEDSDEGVNAFAPGPASVVGVAFTPTPKPAEAISRNVTHVLSDDELTSQHAIADSLDASGGGGGGGGPGTAGGASCVPAPATEGGGSGPAGVAFNAAATAVAVVGAGPSTAPPTPVPLVLPDLQTVIAKVITSVHGGEDCRSTFSNCSTTGEGRVPMNWPQPRNIYLSKTTISEYHKNKSNKFSAQNLGNLSSLV
jgi:hypothetical protein